MSLSALTFHTPRQDIIPTLMSYRETWSNGSVYFHNDTVRSPTDGKLYLLTGNAFASTIDPAVDVTGVWTPYEPGTSPAPLIRSIAVPDFYGAGGQPLYADIDFNTIPGAVPGIYLVSLEAQAPSPFDCSCVYVWDGTLLFGGSSSTSVGRTDGVHLTSNGHLSVQFETDQPGATAYMLKYYLLRPI
jgi:hypothetical protein